jgi:hypothetical protein
MYNMEHFNLLDLDNDILNIIGDYVKKDNHDRLQKICKKYVTLYQKLDREKESERFNNLKGVERKEFHKRVIKTCRRFEKLQDLIENKYYDCRTQFDEYFCRSKSCLIATVLKDGKQQRFRYF